MARKSGKIDRLAWFRCFPARWLNSYAVKRMTRAQRSAYWDLICISWDEGEANAKHRSSIPADDEWIAVQLNMTLDDWLANYKPAIIGCWVEKNGRLSTTLMLEERDHANHLIREGRKAAERGWEGRRKAMGTHSVPSTPDLTCPDINPPYPPQAGGKREAAGKTGKRETRNARKARESAELEAHAAAALARFSAMKPEEKRKIWETVVPVGSTAFPRHPDPKSIEDAARKSRRFRELCSSEA